jgi:hypothetical protein
MLLRIARLERCLPTFRAMREPDSKPKSRRQVREEVPDDVRAELDAEAKPLTTPAEPILRAEPVPEDVLAELDAESRAKQIAEADPDSRPVALDEDSER